MKRIFVLLFILISGYVNSQDYFLKENIDYNVNPAEDFFMFANGNFIKAHPIPPEEHTYGIFNLVEDSVYVYLQRICEGAMNDKSAVQGTNIQKIGDFYNSGLDVNRIESNKLLPLKKYFDQIDNIKDKDGLIKVVTEMQKNSVSPMFSFYVGQDLMNSEKYVIYIGQGGIGLPERDYYFNNDERNKNIRAEYKKHLGKMFALVSPKGDSKAPQIVYNIEYDLAKASRKLEDLRDDYANYNKKSLKELSNITPTIDWNKMFVSFGLNNIKDVIVGQPEFFEALEKALDKYSIDEWKIYLKWNVLNSTSTLLSNDIDQLNFDFYGKVMSGTTEQRPRWKRVLDNTNEFNT
jgi:putative endopeptidase